MNALIAGCCVACLGAANPNQTFTNAANLKPAFVAAQTQKIAVVGIGDSNQGIDNFGWNWGLQYGMVQAGLQMYGTGLVSTTEWSGSPTQLGYKYRRYGGPGTAAASTTPPAQLAVFADKGSGDVGPYEYSNISATAVVNSDNIGLVLDADCPIDVNGALTFSVWHGTFASGTGSMRLKMRQNSTPFTNIANATAINPVTGAYGMTKTTVSLGSGLRDYPILGQYATATNTLAGQAFLTYTQFVNDDKTAGFHYTTLDYRGGQSLRTMAIDLQQMSDEFWTHFLTATRDSLGADKIVVFTINSGINDRGETSASVGPSPTTPGDSWQAYNDNAQAIINKVKAIYTLNGWDETKLYFLLMPSHVISSPDDAELWAYRYRARDVANANDNTCAVNLGFLVGYDEMLNGLNGSGTYYNNSISDKIHLNQTGYEALGAKVLAGIMQ